MFARCIIAGLAGWVALAGASAQAQTTLAWKFVAGQTLNVELVQRVETETQFGARPVRVSVDTTLEQIWRVGEVAADGSALIEQEFARIAVKLDLPQAGSIAYDSAAAKKPTAEAKNLAESLGPIVGAKVRVKLAKSGEILEATLDESLAAHLTELPKDSGWKSMFSRDGLRQLLRQSLVAFPAEPIGVDGTWQRQLDVASPLGQIRQTTDYRYAGAENRDMRTLERIDVTSRVEVKKGEGSAEPPTIKDQSQTGQIWFDASAGRLAESLSTQKLRTEGKVRDTTVTVVVTSTLRTRMTGR